MQKEYNMKKREKLQWHEPFTAATKLALREDRDLFVFEDDYTLSSKPLKIDLLIIRKIADAEPRNEIAKIFRKYNILEYKSPGNALNIDTWFKTIAYASLYKSLGSRVDERKAEEITITLIREKRPSGLFSVLKNRFDISVREAYPGIWYFTGNTQFPTQFIETGRLDSRMNNWLRCLTRNATSALIDEFFEQSAPLVEQGDIENADSVLSLMAEANSKLFIQKRKEKTNMTEKAARILFPEKVAYYEAEIAKRDAAIADQKVALADKDAIISKIRKENARLRAKNATKKK